MKPEEVEDELRKAIEGLNLEDSSATWKLFATRYNVYGLILLTNAVTYYNYLY